MAPVNSLLYCCHDDQDKVSKKNYLAFFSYKITDTRVLDSTQLLALLQVSKLESFVGLHFPNCASVVTL